MSNTQSLNYNIVGEFEKLVNFVQLEIDQAKENKNQKEATANTFRLKQIEEEGNDPSETGQVYGTPSQLATAYGKGRGDNDVPTGYNEKDPNEPVHLVGRPKSSVSNINRQDNPFGKDRLGSKEYHSPEQGEERLGKTQYKGGSPLALESTRATYFKNKSMFFTFKTNNFLRS